MSSTGEDELRPVDRRSFLRVGSVAAAGAGVAALLPAQRADAVSPPATTTLGEAFAGVTVPPRALERWLCSRSSVLNVVCIGDSLTQGTVGHFDYEHGGTGSWVERLAGAMGRAIGPNIGHGFHGLWLGLDAGTNSATEWHAAGTWTRTTPKQPFDVCPFGDGFYADGGATTVLTWTKPTGEPATGFELYWFHMPGAGNWQYRVDAGPWTNMGQPLGAADNKLHKFYVPRPVHARVEIRAYDGRRACLAPIGGISTYSHDPLTASGVIVHNLGRDEYSLQAFVRASSGDPLAWLDAAVSDPATLAIRPALVAPLFSNDVELTSVAMSARESPHRDRTGARVRRRAPDEPVRAERPQRDDPGRVPGGHGVRRGRARLWRARPLRRVGRCG